MQSAFFLGIAPAAFFAAFCLLRRSTDRFYWATQCALPPLIGGLLSILIESPNRRQALALFSLNQATEIVFKRLVNRGYVWPLPHGEVLVFATSMALLTRMAAKYGHERDPISTALKLLLGEQETLEPIDNNNVHTKDGRAQLFRHHQCRHDESTCLEYVVKASVKGAAIGYFGQLILATAVKPKIGLSFAGLRSNLTSSRTVDFALFLATFSGLYRLTSCGLRWTLAKSTETTQTVAGFVAGLSSILWPSTNLSLYLMWKSFWTIYIVHHKFGNISISPESAATGLFAMACGQILYCMPMEQSLVRKSYMSFLDKVTHGRIYGSNVIAFDMMGGNASTGLHGRALPDLDPKYLSPQFMETIFTWLI